VQRPVFVVILAVLLVASLPLGLSCTPQAGPDISVTELDNGVMVKNVGSVDCIVFDSSPEGEQQFELAVGQNRTVTGISQPIKVSAVKR